MLEQLQAPALGPPARLVAIHEAGHAIAALELGYPMESVSVLEDADTLGRLLTPPGWPERARYTDASERMLVEAAVTVHLAGPAATAFLEGRDADGESADERRACQLARALGNGHRDVHDAYLHWQRTRARVLVQRRWQPIQAIAQALLRHGALSASQARHAARNAA